MSIRGQDSRGPVEAAPGAVDFTLLSHDRLVDLGMQAVRVGFNNILNDGKDLPIGAIAVSRGEVIGEGVPRDITEGVNSLHAANIAIEDAKKRSPGRQVDTIVMSTEPSAITLYAIGNGSGARRIFYVSPRSFLVEAGLVRPNQISTEKVLAVLDNPLEITEIEDPTLKYLNELVFSCVQRDLDTGVAIPDVNRFLYLQSTTPELIAS
ncbi:MAG TPA: hypothetical protein VIH90_01105 [Candidatus Saccharimonadales bacterium]